jgi:hypothetical protein
MYPMGLYEPHGTYGSHRDQLIPPDPSLLLSAAG